jgi:hypothetical protein
VLNLFYFAENEKIRLMTAKCRLGIIAVMFKYILIYTFQRGLKNGALRSGI